MCTIIRLFTRIKVSVLAGYGPVRIERLDAAFRQTTTEIYA